MNLLRKARQIASNIPGWHTGRKIVLIQSDDWGSIRMPSLKLREYLGGKPLIDASDAYSHYDTLESTKDLSALYEVLNSVKDKDGRSAVITANCIMANPDFEAIKYDDFQNYHYEPVGRTFDRYDHPEVVKLWLEGKEKGLFIPQFHGREHINVPFWMHQLQAGHTGVRHAFDVGVCSLNFHELPYRKANFQAAWDFTYGREASEISRVIEDGLHLFNKLFQDSSKTAIAPSYVWSKDQEWLLKRKGIRALQGIPFQFIPAGLRDNYKKKFRYTAYSIPADFGYQMRNVFFEPTLQPRLDAVNDSLRRIETIFKMRKPAIIGSHRLNFVGGLDEKNRSKNLKLFRQLLSEIVKKWPTVEFRSSDELFYTN